MLFRHLALPTLAALWCLTGSAAVTAQIILPGAVLPKGTAAGEVLSLSPGKAKRKNAATGDGSTIGKPPGEELVAGRPLYLNGGASMIELARHDKGLEVKKLTLRGEQSAKPGEACEVNVALTPALAAKLAGQPAGLLRYEVELEACPFSFDILEDAVLVDSPNLTCEFKEAGCMVSAAGLWGPKASAFTPAKAKDTERARTRWEAAVRAAFREAAAAADKNEVKLIAREQAGFSSVREEQCRGYAGESAYGFCAARITQARAFALKAKSEKVAEKGKAERDEKKGKK